MELLRRTGSLVHLKLARRKTKRTRSVDGESCTVFFCLCVSLSVHTFYSIENALKTNQITKGNVCCLSVYTMTKIYS